MIVIDKWAGLVTNASPYSVPPGAASTQINWQILSPGQLTCRDGMTSVSFATHAATTSAIVRAFRYPRETENVVYQNSLGQIRVARDPS